MFKEFSDSAFTRWAFGTSDPSTKLIDVPDMWNALHSDIFVCVGASNVRKDLDRMYEAYKESELT